MRNSIFAGALILAAATSAQADWELVEVASAFASSPDRHLSIESDDSLFVLRCKNNTGTADFLAAGYGAYLPPSLDLSKAKVFGALRIDEQDAIQQSASLRVMDGDLVATFPVKPENIKDFAGANDRVAVAILTEKGVVYETEYATEGIAAGINALLEGC